MRSNDDEAGAEAAVPTGRRGQQLICEGWFASHGDSGTPGPHLHPHTSDSREPVLRTDQLPIPIAALTQVAERIDRLWATDGDRRAAEVVLTAPDPQDPEVVRRSRLRRLDLTHGSTTT